MGESSVQKEGGRESPLHKIGGACEMRKSILQKRGALMEVMDKSIIQETGSL